MPRDNTPQNEPLEIPLVSFRSRLIRTLGIGLCMGLLGAMASEIMTVQDGELLIYDWRLRNRPLADRSALPPVTLVMIDDRVAEDVPQYEINKLAHLAELVRFLSDRGTKVIGLDLMLFGHEEADEGGRQLRDEIRSAGNVVLSGHTVPDPHLGMGRQDRKSPNFLIEAAAASGLQHLVVGTFGLVRDAHIRKAFVTKDQTNNNFAVLVASLAERQILPSSFAGLEETFWTTPFSEATDSRTDFQIPIGYKGPRSEVGDYNGTFPCLRADLDLLDKVQQLYFKDRIVIVGSARTRENTSYPTPLGVTRATSQVEMYTAEIMANLVETILEADYIRRFTKAGAVLWLLGVGLLASLLCLNRRLLPVILYTLVLTLVLFFFSKHLFNEMNLVTPFFPTLMVPWFTALASIATRVTLDDRQIRLLRDVFGRSVSPAIAQELVYQVSSGRRGGGTGSAHMLSEECACSILFLDVANFTTLSEHLEPAPLFKFTNELLDRLSKCVFDNEGSLIRYTGDGLIALFGRPIVREDHACLACEAALRMQEELHLLNLERTKQGEPTVQIRVGVNTGSIMVGLLGGKQRYDYSILGNEVNIAARFEKLNKDFGTATLVGEPTVRELRNEFICRPLGSISLKGKTQQVSVYELVCRTGEAIPDYLRDFLKLYEEGYIAIRSNRFQEAISAFNNALVYKSDDLATQKLLSRAEERTRTSTSPS